MKIRGALKKKANIALIFQLEPKKVDEALKDPSYKLVSKPTNVAIIGTKWVFKNKLNEYGKVVRNKARLVARGYSQQEGDNYDETFTLVAQLESIHIFLNYASFKGFKQLQMNFKSYFLNRFIDEEVCVK